VAAVLSAVALLVAGAAVAAYAALSETSSRARPASSALARTPVTPPRGSSAALPPTSATTPPPTVPKIGAVHKRLPPLVKAPAVPLVSSNTTPASTTPANTTTHPATTTAPATKHTTKHTTTTTTPSSGTTPAEKLSEAILIDTNAGSTYNPDGLPASGFGDPALAIDGETATAWTARVPPATAPRLDAGLLIDLKSAQRLSKLELITSTPGMSVQVFASAAPAAPASITTPGWVRLSKVVVAKHTSRIALSNSKESFRFVALWISKAPTSGAGTGRVSVNEVELFPAG
jgi:hypothetical protein